MLGMAQDGGMICGLEQRGQAWVHGETAAVSLITREFSLFF